MSYQCLIYEVRDHVAEITLNRPEAGNAFNTQLCDELYDAWKDIAADDNVLGVILTGAGDRFFTAGADLKEFNKRRESGEEKVGPYQKPTREHPRTGWPDRPAGMWKPVMLAINGICLGGGWHILWQSDFAICSENATFFDTHVSIGWLAVRELLGAATRMPFGHTMRLFLGGKNERLTAEQALQCGLVTEVVPLKDLMPRAREIMGNIVENAPVAVRATVELLQRARGLEYEYKDMVWAGIQLRSLVQSGHDYLEGPRAFAEKRKPDWKGR